MWQTDSCIWTDWDHHEVKPMINFSGFSAESKAGDYPVQSDMLHTSTDGKPWDRLTPCQRDSSWVPPDITKKHTDFIPGVVEGTRIIDFTFRIEMMGKVGKSSEHHVAHLCLR